MTTKEASDYVEEVCRKYEKEGDRGLLREALRVLVQPSDKTMFVVAWNIGYSQGDNGDITTAEEAWKEYNGW